MNVKWQDKALDDLLSIVAYIRDDNREAAQRVYEAIKKQASFLADFREFGRVGWTD